MSKTVRPAPTDPADGYVAALGYTYGYFPEINPLRMRFALLLAGFTPPAVQHACELGFGQGISLNVHAAASSVQWWGTDFNPQHASLARELAGASGNGASVFNDAFDDFAARTDLPEFDYIALHGVWSWVTPAVQQQIVAFLRQKLRPGGVAYLGYNALPGWTNFLPLRQLMTAHANRPSASGVPLEQRIADSVSFMATLFATEPSAARGLPQLADRVDQWQSRSANYLAHEYFNEAWDPVHFSHIAKALAAADLSFAGSAQPLDDVDSLNLSAAQQALLATIPEQALREDTRDYMVNRQFRRDYWIKGARRLSPTEREDALRESRVVLTLPRDRVVLKASGALGESSLNARRYQPILELLADHQPHAIDELAASLGANFRSFDALVEAVAVLVGTGQVAPAQDDSTAGLAASSAQRLNAEFARRAAVSADISVLASPLTGGGVEVGRLSQLFLHAIAMVGEDSRLWAPYVWHILEPQGHRFRRDGHVLDGREDNLEQLTVLAATFKTHALPVLQRLGMVGV